MIVDGQNNHSWYKTTPVMKEALEKTDRFDVDVLTSPAVVPRKPRLRKEHEADEAKVEAWKKAVEKWEKRLPQLQMANEEAWKTWRPTFSGYDVVVSNYNGESWPKEVETAFEEYMKAGGGLMGERLSFFNEYDA